MERCGVQCFRLRTGAVYTLHRKMDKRCLPGRLGQRRRFQPNLGDARAVPL